MKEFLLQGGPYDGKLVPLSPEMGVLPGGIRATLNFTACGQSGAYYMENSQRLRWYPAVAPEAHPTNSVTYGADV